jgi:hypothetical protein
MLKEAFLPQNRLFDKRKEAKHLFGKNIGSILSLKS